MLREMLDGNQGVDGQTPSSHRKRNDQGELGGSFFPSFDPWGKCLGRFLSLV